MFFPAFSFGLPQQIIFLVEHLVSILLCDSDENELRDVLAEGQLVDYLFTGLNVLGSVPKSLQKNARAYLTAHAEPITAAAQSVLNAPRHQAIRALLLTAEETRINIKYGSGCDAQKHTAV